MFILRGYGNCHPEEEKLLILQQPLDVSVAGVLHQDPSQLIKIRKTITVHHMKIIELDNLLIGHQTT